MTQTMVAIVYRRLVPEDGLQHTLGPLVMVGGRESATTTARVK